MIGGSSWCVIGYREEEGREEEGGGGRRGRGREGTGATMLSRGGVGIGG